MATKRDDAPLPRLMQSRKWLLVLAVVLLAAFVALDQWRTAQPVLTQAMLPAGATTAAAAGRNTPQPRTRLGIIPGHNRVRKVGGEFERVLEPDPVTGMPPDPGAIIELGFMNDDKVLLKQGDLPVKGLLDGIRCFAAKQGIIGDR